VPSSQRPLRAGFVGMAVTTALLAVLAFRVTPGASADPAWIVFSATPDGAGAAQLFRVQTNGEGLKQITSGGLLAGSPDFSPNGARIAFSRLGSGLFTVNLDGTGLRRLTSGPRDSQPVYSPDGKRIAFLRPLKAGWRVLVMPAAGGKPRLLPQAPPAGRPSWTRDGKAIIVPTAVDVLQIDPQTGKVQKYFGITLDLQTAQTANVSPDDQTIAYVGQRLSTGPPDCGEGRCPQYALYVAGVQRPHRPRRLVNDTGPAGWAPDGRTLVFVAKGTLTLLTVGSGAKATIGTGTHVASGDFPPAWQPR
jgi:TolB protein